ncbi:unnamed protein product [Linum trigynum]|uniref:Uncharacterized protein n=1 Tax=Linum trigynum TaxID=586398 RepID=A0AAV2ER93_9ROSI
MNHTTLGHDPSHLSLQTTNKDHLSSIISRHCRLEKRIRVKISQSLSGIATGADLKQVDLDQGGEERRSSTDDSSVDILAATCSTAACGVGRADPTAAYHFPSFSLVVTPCRHSHFPSSPPSGFELILVV